MMGDHKRVVAGCPTKKTCTEDGYNAAQGGNALVPINAAAWAVGAAGLVAGVTLVVLGRNPTKPAAPSARLVVLPGGATIEGSF